MDSRQIDPGIRDDVPQRRGGISLIAEQPFRRVQDLLLCFGHSINSIKQLYYTLDFRIVKKGLVAPAILSPVGLSDWAGRRVARDTVKVW
jgi:hypothetical protein